MTPPSAQPATAMVTRRGLWGWMLFDWAAQPFFTVVTTFIFGPYFTATLVANSNTGLAYWGFAAAGAGLVIAVFSPILGAVADAAGPRKPWIIFLAIIKIAALMGLWFSEPGAGEWIILQTIALFSLATIAAEFSIVFNDSMMGGLAPPARHGTISNLAWGLGYASGMLMLIFVVGFLVASPETGTTLLGLPPLFGLDPAAFEAERLVGPLAGLWYLLFILPMLAFTPDRPRSMAALSAVRRGLGDVWTAISGLGKRRQLAKFLLARMFYQDGLNGLLLLGGAFAVGLFGWRTIEIGLFGIIINVVAIFGCAAASRLDIAWGSKVLVMLSLVILIAATLGIISTGTDYTLFVFTLDAADGGGLFGTLAEKAYLGYGCLIGLAFGPVQASSRSYLSRSISPDESGRYFGLYALTGRATSFLAPFAVASITALTDNAQLGMSVLILFFVIGAALLLTTAYPATNQN